ncbi:MAG: F0F1 ATP synthase subunit gamma [Alphaproteobacteria bacterium]|nr:MAG: F0F1 ATP synthase subunit gamma [Alphaproteobacteria bacterium]
MKLQAIAIKQKNISNIGRITYAIKTIAIAHKKQMYNMYQTIQSSVHLLSYEVKKLKLDQLFGNVLHIVFAAEKKFCKDFLYKASQYISNIHYSDNDKFIIFGKHGINSLKPVEQVSLKYSYNIEDAYVHANNIMEYIKNGFTVKVHFFSIKHDEFISTTIIDKIPIILEDEELVKLLVAYSILSSSIQSSLSENTSRAVAMSQASETCKTMQDQLKLFYNRMRQQKITLEMNEIIGGSGGQV